MKAKLLFFLILPFSFLLSAYAGSATWNANPISRNWNRAINWTPATVPNGPSDVATFGLSNSADVNILQSVEVSEIDFAAGANAFNISAPPGVTLTIDGPGVSNVSGIKQHFIASDNNNASGAILFLNSASAGDGNTYKNKGNTFGFGGYASTQFFGTSNAGTSTIINADAGESFKGGGITEFFDQSSAANSTIINEVDLTGNILDAFGTDTDFNDHSTAANAVLIAKGGTMAFGDDESEINFFDDSTADHATITIEAGGPVINGAGGIIGFSDNSTAASATIRMRGAPAGGTRAAVGEFLGSATAGNATIVLESGEGAGASLNFFNTSSGGQAAFTVNGNAELDLSQHSAPGMAVGSIAGDGMVQLGSLSLTVGTNNLDTQFGGRIDDGANTTGSLVKTGSGRLTLSGGNTYDGGTTVNSGTLVVTNLSGSATGTGVVQVSGGTLGGSGTISGVASIGTGSGSGAFLAPAAGRKPRTLHLAGDLTFKSDATYAWTIRSKGQTVQSDEVVAQGVTIESGAQFSVVPSVRGSLSLGTVLTVISNSSATPISGAFSNLPDGAVINVNGNNLQASYTGGDGNDLTLTVAP